MAMANNIVMNNTPAAPQTVQSPSTANTPNGPSTYSPYNTQMNNAVGNNVGNIGQGGGPQKGAVASPYAVLTSQPATDNYNSIQSDYENNIKPAIQQNSANTAASKALPTIEGYNVSATPTGNQGEQKATNQTTGGSYYITPQQTGTSDAALKSILSSPEGGETPNPATPQTPVQTAQAQTGINPSAENANYQTAVQGINDDVSNAATSFSNLIQTISSSIPLSPAQQSLVDATNQAFNAMTNQADLKAAALSSETGGVSNKINAMGGELIQIATAQAAAVAKLEVGFQQENYQEKYQTITAAYSAYKDAETAKMDALTKIHDSVMSTYQNAITAANTAAQQAETERHNAAEERLAQEGTYSVVTNPDGTQSIFNNKTGAVVGKPNDATTGGGSVLDGTLTPGNTGVPIVDMNTKYSTTGIPYVDGTNLTGKQADAAQLRAARMGLPYMGKTQADRLSKIEDAKSNLNAVQMSLMAYLPKDAMGRIVGGPENKMSALLQTNDQLAAFGSWRTAAIGILQALAGGQGSGLRINQAEIKLSTENDIPNITDTVGVAQTKVGNIMKLLDNSEKAIFGQTIYDKYNPNSPSHQAGAALDNLFGTGTSGGSTTAADSTVSTAFSNVGI